MSHHNPTNTITHIAPPGTPCGVGCSHAAIKLFVRPALVTYNGEAVNYHRSDPDELNDGASASSFWPESERDIDMRKLAAIYEAVLNGNLFSAVKKWPTDGPAITKMTAEFYGFRKLSMDAMRAKTFSRHVNNLLRGAQWDDMNKRDVLEEAVHHLFSRLLDSLCGSLWAAGVG